MNQHKKRVSQIEVAIVGLPNVGKTQIFNNLTGKYGIVANYPSTTVIEKSGAVRIERRTFLVIDTPGFHGLYADSEEELYVRNLLVKRKPAIILQCIDANRLKQSLYLTAQLLELDIPMIISLNIIDETIKYGKIVDAAELSIALGIPVVECIATEGKGTTLLKHALGRAAIGTSRVEYFPHFEHYAGEVCRMLPPNAPLPNLATRLILQRDRFVFETSDWLPGEQEIKRLREIVREAWRTFDGNFNKAINHSITKWVDGIEALVVSKTPSKPGRFAEIAARMSRHPVWGIPILLLFVALCYFSVIYVAGSIAGFFSHFVFNPLTTFLEGILPDGFFENILIGKYGVLTLGLFNAIGTVLPVLSVFFFLFGFMEDVGHLPNLGILAKRTLNRMGLSGKSIMPLILGFGCKTMAQLTIRNIPSRKEKNIVTYLIAFAIPCSAQLGLIMAILGKNGFAPLVIYFLFLIIIELAAGMILNKVLKDDEKSQFIQELPPFRIPMARALLVKTGNRLLWFLKEATPVFVGAALAIFFLDLSGALRILKDIMAPVIVSWLGLPIEMVDTLLLTLTRKEIGAGYILNLADAGKLSYIQSIIAVVLSTMFIPCSAHVAAMVKERGIKTVVMILSAIGVSTFLLAWILKLILGIFVKG